MIIILDVKDFINGLHNLSLLQTPLMKYPLCGIYRIRQNSRGGKLLRFLLNRESFPVETFTRLGIHYYKKLLPRKFSRQIFIYALTTKVIPLDCFDVYGIRISDEQNNRYTLIIIIIIFHIVILMSFSHNDISSHVFLQHFITNFIGSRSYSCHYVLNIS